MFTETYHLKSAVLYTKERGYGFVTEENRAKDELLQLPELNAGFDVPYWYREECVTQIQSDEHGCYIDSEMAVARIDAAQERLIPLCFKADVPGTGNYEVLAELYGAGEILVFAGPRRLVYKADVPKAQRIQIRFILNVCDIIPRGKTCLFERRSVDIAVLGRNVRLSGIVIKQVNCPTLYIAGDSTVTDQSAEYPYDPGTSYSGWGQMIGMYLSSDIAVSNHAHSGLTVESFRTEGHYAIISAHIKFGDYVLFQFGHNDQKLMYLKAEEGYRERILAYIEEIVSRGAYPILVTPLARNSWKADDGTYNDLLAEYAQECITIGRQCNIPVIDLHAASMEFVMEKGLEQAKPFFFPGDFTHTNDYGAYKMAGFVVSEYKKHYTENSIDSYARLAGFMTKDLEVWEAAGPLALPQIPEKYKNIPNPEGEEVLFASVERPEAALTRVEALEMAVQAARFFPTNVFNDMYKDIVGHEWYAGTVQCAYQNGIILPQMIEGNQFEPQKVVTLEEFLALIMGAYKSRRNLPVGETCVLEKQCPVYYQDFVRAAFTLGVVSEQDDLRKEITRGHAAWICRELNI